MRVRAMTKPRNLPSAAPGRVLAVVLQLFISGALLAQDSSEAHHPAVFRDLNPDVEGAPRSNSLGTYVIITDTARDDPFHAAVHDLAAWKAPREVLSFKWGSVAALLPRLRELTPEYVGIVTRPENINLNHAYELLEVSSRLDSDAFPDFTYGFITGATAELARKFIRNMVLAEGLKQDFPRRILEFGPASLSGVNRGSLAWARGWASLVLEQGCGCFPRHQIPRLANNGIIRFWGHGMPDGIRGSLDAGQLRSASLFPAVVFGGPCYTGVTRTSFHPLCPHRVELRETVAADSFCLRLLEAGATAYVGALHTDQCPSAGQEMEYFLSTGEPIGHAVKATYDSIVLASGSRGLTFPPFRKGAPRAALSGVLELCADGASRVLFGDPAFTPVSGLNSSPVDSRVISKGGRFSVSLRVENGRYRHSFRSLYSAAKPGATDRLATRVELSRALASSGRLQVVRTSSPSVTLRGLFCGLEKWGGRRYLHIQVDLPSGSVCPCHPLSVEIECRPVSDDTRAR